MTAKKSRTGGGFSYNPPGYFPMFDDRIDAVEEGHKGAQHGIEGGRPSKKPKQPRALIKAYERHLTRKDGTAATAAEAYSGCVKDLADKYRADPSAVRRWLRDVGITRAGRG